MLKKFLIAIVVIFAIIGMLFTGVFLGMQLGLFNVRGSISERNHFFLNGRAIGDTPPCDSAGQSTCSWDKTPEWDVIKNALAKDAPIITQVSLETGVSKRMIAAVVVPEQIRFFTSEREIFKRYFEPLKILVSLSQFSLGVSGIKQETAEDIEMFANDSASPFYPGPLLAEKIAYPKDADTGTELYNRLTDPKDHYYSYLYTALYIKEIQSQWAKSGFDISEKPEVVVTLFNIGFAASKPNANPHSGGAPVTVGGITYTYGDLGSAFYRSDELSSIFPK